MQLARIDGNATATIAHSSMKGCRVLICQPINEAGEETGLPYLAIDELGAGLHSRVMITTDGSKAQAHVSDASSPLRNMVLGIVDEKEEHA